MSWSMEAQRLSVCMLCGCSGASSVMVSLRMRLLLLGGGSFLVCKTSKPVNGQTSTRLETRTKESNACVSSWVIKPCCVLKDIVGT